MDDAAHLENSETTEASPWSIEYVAETGSTQTDLIERAEVGTLANRTALRTGFQRTGRGRLNRTWGAPPDTNLLVSLGFTEVPADPAELMRRVGVAAVDAVASFVRAQRAVGAPALVGLKWPNDLLIDGRKAAGMLAQRSGAGPVVVGLGLNVGWAPPGAASIAQYCAASVPQPGEVLAVLLDRFDDLGGSVDVAGRYRARLVTLGQAVRVELADEIVEGVAVDIGVGGELVVRSHDGVQHDFSVGDVTHLRALTPPKR